MRRAATGLAFGLLVLCACSEEAGPSVDRPSGSLTRTPQGPALDLPDDPAVLLSPGEAGQPPQQLGRAPLMTRELSLAGGDVRTGTTPEGGAAFVFPAFTREATYPRAVVVAQPTTRRALAPRRRSFEWGADILVDERSAGRAEDDGNNIIQRGLSVDPVMFKLEIDASMRPSCVAKGARGQVDVYAAQAIEPGTWYRLRCTRQKGSVTLYIGEYLPSGATTATTREDSGRVGAMAFADPATAFTVGGKVAEDGDIVRDATDQFNGSIANPYFALTGS